MLYRCVCNTTPLNDVSALGASLRGPAFNCCYGTPVHYVHIPTGIFSRGGSGFVTGSLCGVWDRGLITCHPYVGPFFGKSILIKFVVQFNRMENSILYYVEIYWDYLLIYMYILPPQYFSFFYCHFHNWNSFCVDCVLHTSISLRLDPYPFQFESVCNC